MKRNTHHNIVMDMRRLMTILDQGDVTALRADQKRKELHDDRDHTEAWKAPKYKEINNWENGIFRNLGHEAEKLYNSIIDKVNKCLSDFDYTDEDLQSALFTIDVMGKNLPSQVAENIADRFQGNPIALDMLLPLYKQYNYNTQKIEQFQAPLKSLNFSNNDTITEFVAWSTSEMAEHNKWQSGGVKRIINAYANGLGLDISVNPYKAEIDKLYDQSTDSMQKARIDVFRRNHGTDLEVDNPDAIALAEKHLNNGFNRPVM